jgi:hypothetical protein
MNAQVHAEELDRLLGGWCDGTLSADDGARLDSLIQSNDDARRFYNNYMFLHAELYAQHASLNVESRGSRVESREPKIAFEPERAVSSPTSSSRWFAIAATILGVAISSSWLTIAMTRDRGQVAQSAAAATGETVARITASRNCLWQPGSQNIGYGSQLTAGQRLELSTGLVEITFADGAAVVLEGPATFDVHAPGKAELHEGRLAAVVPERAHGFQIATSRLNVVDLGTEFGLMTEPEGPTEVHVFNGLVKAQLLDESGHQVRTVELNTSEAARIQPATSLVARIPARDEEFVRSLSIAPGPHDGLYAYDGFNYPAGPLAEQNGGFGWAGPWFNVEADVAGDPNSNGVKADSLAYDGLMPLGNRAVQTAQQNRVRRSMGTSVGGVFDAAGLVENQDAMRLVGRDGTVVYLSFLQRVDKTNDVFYGFELHRGDGNANRVLCIGHGAENTGYGVTSNVNVYGQRNFPALGAENTETNFFVIRMTFGAGNRDRVEVFRNPESLVDEEACVPDAELVGNFSFDRISMGNFHGSKVHEIDEVRVGTTFRAVTGRRGRGPDRLMPRVAWEGAPESRFRGDGSEMLQILGNITRRGRLPGRVEGAL